MTAEPPTVLEVTRLRISEKLGCFFFSTTSVFVLVLVSVGLVLNEWHHQLNWK